MEGPILAGRITSSRGKGVRTGAEAGRFVGLVVSSPGASEEAKEQV